MTPGFEMEPEKTSSAGTAVESRTEKMNTDDAFEAAEASVEEFTRSLHKRAGRRLEEDPSVHLKGRDKRLSELPDEYREVGLIQKRVDLIEEQLEQVLSVNETSDPGSHQEAVSYFQTQILARMQEAEKKRAALNAQTLGFKLQHPDIYRALATSHKQS